MKSKKNTAIKRPIVLSIETKVREFPGKVLLASVLAERGFRVLLTNHRRIKNMSSLCPWLYIDRNTFMNRIKFFSDLRKMGARIACIDEEGIIWANPRVYQNRLNPQVMSMTDLFFTWGKKQSDLVADVGFESLIRETGNPRMDLLRPELRGLYLKKADLLSAKYGDFILIVSNFAWNNHYYVDKSSENPVEPYLELLRRQGQIENEKDETFYRENFEYKEKVFNKFLDLTKTLSHEFPDKKIIVRPHPSENHENWVLKLENLSNVEIVFEGELEPWLMAACSVIHNSCTSGVLTALLNLKSISFMPYHDERFEHDMPNRISAQASTKQEVCNLIKSENLVQDVPELLKEYISATSGKLAVERIADIIESEYKRPISETFQILFLKTKDLVCRSVNKVNPYMKKNNRSQDNKNSNYKEQKAETIQKIEITDYIEIFSSMLGRFKEIQVDEKKDYFEITL